MLRLVVTLLGRATGQESILPAKMTHHRRPLISMGVGTLMGVEGRPLPVKPQTLWQHFIWLRAYGQERWAQKQKARKAKHKVRSKASRAGGAATEWQPTQATVSGKGRGQAYGAAVPHGLLCAAASTLGGNTRCDPLGK